jgi:hypothetical protein
MNAGSEQASAEASRPLDDRVLSMLVGLHGRIAFSGLRRVLHAHPESLSRALRRLEREGRIERSSEGYRAVRDGLNRGPDATSGLRQVAQVGLPPGTIPASVMGQLSGRWFGSLRWVGVVDGPTERFLAWARRDGAGYVLLGIRQGSLRVYVRDEASGDDEGEAEDSAYELLSHALDVLRTPLPGPVNSVTFLTAGWDSAHPAQDN